MEKMISDGEFLENTEFSSNLYGTRLEKRRQNGNVWHEQFTFSKKAVTDVTSTGRICLLDVDKQGVKNIRATDLKAVFIYVSPPSFEVLSQRLRARQTDSESAIEKRLNEAKESMEFSKEPGVYDHIILNDQLDDAYQQLVKVLIQVKNKTDRLLKSCKTFFVNFFFRTSKKFCKDRKIKFQFKTKKSSNLTGLFAWTFSPVVASIL